MSRIDNALVEGLILPVSSLGDMAGPIHLAESNDTNISTDGPLPPASLISRIIHYVTVTIVLIDLTVFAAIYFVVIMAGSTILAAPLAASLAAASQYALHGATRYPLQEMFLDYVRATAAGCVVLGACFGAIIGLASTLGLALNSLVLSMVAVGRWIPPSFSSATVVRAKQIIFGVVELPLGVAVLRVWQGERFVESVTSGGLLQAILFAAVSNAVVFSVMKTLFHEPDVEEVIASVSGEMKNAKLNGTKT